MAKIVVEIEMGDNSAKDLMKRFEKDRAEWFPVGSNFISVDKSLLRGDPTDEGFYLFKLLGVMDTDEKIS